MPGLEGTTLGRYHLQRPLARGGMAEVYLAHDEQMHRDVAIKVVHWSQADAIERFQREVEAVGALMHDHILPAFDYGEQESWSYLVMPYIEHGTLRERLKTQGPLTQEAAGLLLEQIVSALHYAHDHGMLHRDIKSSNILLRHDSYAYLGDFGLAKALDGGSDFTQAGYIIGTPEYMAPELAEQPASISSDIYALGVLLYEMVTGHVPFRGSIPMAVLVKHMHEQPVRPSLLNPAITLPVEQVILCALEKEPSRRFKTPQALAQAYRQALTASEQSVTLPKMVPASLETGNTSDNAGSRHVLPVQSANSFIAPDETTDPIIPVSPPKKMQQAAPPPVVPWLLRPRQRSHNRMAMAFLVALVLLLVISLSLGFFVQSSSHRSPTPSPTITGTGGQFGTPTQTPQGHATAPAQSTPTGNTSGGSGAPVKQQPKHGHGHGHGHKQGNGDE
jgi:serine/threonine protein kinase